MTRGKVAVKNIRDCRAMSSLFRQFAVFDVVHSSKCLIEAQRWEHLAEAEITSYFKECNATRSATALAVSPALIHQKEPLPKPSPARSAALHGSLNVGNTCK